MAGGTTPLPLLRSPAPHIHPSTPSASTASGEVHGEAPASGKIREEPQDFGDFRGGEQRSSHLLIRMKQESSEICGEPHSSEVAKMPSSSKKSSKKKTPSQEETHPTARSKRTLSEAGGSSRAIKAAKIINKKVVLK